MINTVLIPFIASALGFTVAGFTLSRLFKRNDIADVLWGLGFVGIAVVHAVQSPELAFRARLMLILITLWGLRLSLHLGIRTFSKSTEDVRYANWRTEWGTREPLMAFAKVFLLQGVMLALIAMPIGWVMQAEETALTPWDFLGSIIFVIGFLFESIADAQLARFKRDPANRGKVLTQGVWALSRHPNYFGEILVWWGVFFIALSTPGSLWLILSPLVITFLLLKVSGVPMLEKLMAKRGREFTDYVASTPALMPFRMRALKTSFAIAFTFLVLDFVWLAIATRGFYQREGSLVFRFASDGGLDVVGWAGAGVYFFMTLVLQVFAVSGDRLNSLFRGALLGLCLYSFYDLTNAALVRNWSLRMALVDILWGTTLCSVAALMGSRTMKS